MITPEQQQQIDNYLKTSNYKPPTQGPSWYDQVKALQANKKPTQPIQPEEDSLSKLGGQIMGNTTPDQGAMFSVSKQDVQKPGTGIGIASKAIANVVPDFVRTTAGFPVATAGQVSQLGTEAKGLFNESKPSNIMNPAAQARAKSMGLDAGPQNTGLMGTITNMLKNMSSAAKDPNLHINQLKAIVPSSAQKLVKGDFSGAAQDIANHPFQQIAPWLMALEQSAKLVGKGPVIDTAISKIASPVTEGIPSLYKAITEKSPQQVDQFIQEQFAKGVKPSITGKGTVPQVEAYKAKSAQAVRTIVQNKNSLKILDAAGEETGKVPENLDQFSQAIDQTKKIIFEKYNTLQKAAGAKGATVELNSTASELRKISSDPVTQDVNPEVASYANKVADAFEQRGSYTTEQAQSAIEKYNASLKAFYRNPTYETASRATIDAMVANRLRMGLDNIIENTTEAGYQDLKNRYGSLKTIENDVVKRAQVDARKNTKGLIDYTDILTGAEALRGVLRMSPVDMATSAMMKGIQMYYKYLNNPNTAIKRLFQAVEKSSGSDTTVPPGTGQLESNKTSSTSIAKSNKEVNPPKIKAGMALKDVNEINPQDVGELNDFLDYARGDYKPSKTEAIRLEIAARRIVEENGGIPEMSNKKLANQIASAFKDPISSLKAQGGIPKLTQEATKYKSAEEFVKAQTDSNKAGRFIKEKDYVVKDPANPKFSGKFSEYALDNSQRKGKLSVEKSKLGWRVRNIFVDDGVFGENLRRQGIATDAYRSLNEQSILDTGKPLRSSDVGYARKTSVTTLSDNGESVWKKLVANGEAEKVGDHYQFTPKSQLTDIWNKANKR